MIYCANGICECNKQGICTYARQSDEDGCEDFIDLEEMDDLEAYAEFKIFKEDLIK